MNYLYDYGGRNRKDIVSAQVLQIIDGWVANAPIHAAVSGVYGSGKSMLTSAVGKSLVCSARAAMRPCGDCPQCLFVEEQRRSGFGAYISMPDGGSLEMVDCTKLSVEHAADIIQRITLYRNAPLLVAFDEFHQAHPDVKKRLLKPLEGEIEIKSSLIFCFASTSTDAIAQPLLQRLHEFVLRKPEVDELLPLVGRVIEGEKIPFQDEAVLKELINLCGRIPRVVLKALEMLAFDGKGISPKTVHGVISSLEIINNGKAKS